jgi:hypothetical protein
MSSFLLDKLRIKNQPLKPRAVDIVLKPPAHQIDVEVKTKVLDHRSKKFDREAFLRTFVDTQPVTHTDAPVPIEKIHLPTGVVSKTKPIKLKKKLKLVQSSDMSSTTLAVEEMPKIKKKPRKFVILDDSPEPDIDTKPKPAPEPELIKAKKKKRNFVILDDSPDPDIDPPVPEPEPAPAPLPATVPVPELIKAKKKKRNFVILDDSPEPDIDPPAAKAVKHTIPKHIRRVLPAGLVKIGDTSIKSRLAPIAPHIIVKASAYYMDNREIFINFINSLFAPHKEALKLAAKSASCDSRLGDDFSLMAHQQIVRDYINLYTPYRGLLLYHGLGSGKTCSSIAIAEGMKNDKKIIIMTPASLKRNYFEELKKCGDTMYKKNQYWEFVKVTPENIATLSTVLNLTDDYIRTHGGAWLVNIKKPSNIDSLTSEEKDSLDKQLNEMIMFKYKFISYNGLRKSNMQSLIVGGKNPFDNAVVIIDEAHNLVSRIVNKISKKKSDSVSITLYELLMSASNAKIILLSGTPIINYPNEIGITFNILRGYIKTWKFNLSINSDKKISKKTFEELFSNKSLGGNITDFIDYNSSTTTLTVTRNPFGFINNISHKVYEGVRINESGDMSDAEFIIHLTKRLSTIKIKVNSSSVDLFKALPDTLDEFKNYFIDSKNNLQNTNLLKRRILGLTSYFRSAQENLMPRYTKSSNFYVVDCIMSDFQFAIYENTRAKERKQELNTSRQKGKQNKDIFTETKSTYKIFSRAFCNFVFPKPFIERPKPGFIIDESKAHELDENMLDAGPRVDNIDGIYEADELCPAQQAQCDDDLINQKLKAEYDAQLKLALKELSDRKYEFLTMDGLDKYSPKFKTMILNIISTDHVGLHLVYSQFRTLEGIGIFKFALEANGFAEFKIKQVGGTWRMNISAEDRGKPTFVLYTGTESPELKEIVRNVYNGDWKYIPPSLREDLLAISDNNVYGEIIKVFMITASGAEGISLKNTRYVHIMEPYWHPVRMQQVIGRARRICSHQDLPEELKTVDVFLYLMKFSDAQLDVATIELKLKDVSKVDSVTPFTSDQTLWEIANIKEELTDKLLTTVKESSIDCMLHSNVGSEKLKCLSFGTIDPTKFSYSGSINNAEVDSVVERNVTEVHLDAVEATIEGIKYAVVRKTGHVYDWESYMLNQPVQIGSIVKNGTKYEFSRI